MTQLMEGKTLTCKAFVSDKYACEPPQLTPVGSGDLKGETRIGVISDRRRLRGTFPTREIFERGNP